MTNEQRLDRIERIARLFVKAGLRVRQQIREHDDKINILIDFQMQNAEKAARQDEKLGMLQEQNEARFTRQDEKLSMLQEQNEARFARQDKRISVLQERTEERFAWLAESQASTNRRLDSLIEIVSKGRNGSS